MEDLETRINTAQIDRVELINSLCTEQIRPREVNNPYLKYDLSDKIAAFLQKKGVYLTEQERSTKIGGNLYTAINKEPLKRVGYGIINAGRVPKEVFQAMTEWENLYFLAGLWNKKSTPIRNKQYDRVLLAAQSAPLIIAETIAAGIYSLKNIHEMQVADGNYNSEINLPYSDKLLEQYKQLK